MKNTRAIPAALCLILCATLPQSGSSQDAYTEGPLRACTLVGCGDTFLIALRAADGKTPSRLPGLILEIDGRRIRCVDVTIDDDGQARCSNSEDDIMRLSIGQDTQCDPDGTCVSSGDNVVRILVLAAPTVVKISLAADPAQQATFKPTYDTRYPNGPDCAPACKSARATWVARHPW